MLNFSTTKKWKVLNFKLVPVWTEWRASQFGVEMVKRLQERSPTTTSDDLMQTFEMLDRADGKKDGLITKGFSLQVDKSLRP